MQRIPALTAAIWHNDHTGQPVLRSLTAYDHGPLGTDHLVLRREVITGLVGADVVGGRIRRMGEGGYSLRMATADDAGFLTDMLVAAVNWDPAREAVSRDRVLMDRQLAHYIEGWPLPGDLGVVAVEAGGQPIGAAWLRLFSPDDPGYGFVSEDVPELSVGVLPSWRRKGVGRALLTEIAQQAAERGVARICLSVERANRARRLYVAEGFTTVESGPDSDTMILVLSDG